MLRRLPTLGRFASLLSLLITGVGAGLTASSVPQNPESNPVPSVGFTYSPWAARSLGLDPWAALDTLLTRLQPDVVRLPVYWSDVAPTPTGFDFSGVDTMLDHIVRHDAVLGSRTARVVLVVGLRNIGYPELYPASWALSQATAGIPSLVDTPAYRSYLEAAVRRYAHNDLLTAWQLENEPLDDIQTGYAGHADLSASSFASERDLLRSIDSRHPVIVTTYNSATVGLDEIAESLVFPVYRDLPEPQPAGHPLDALRAGDILGLDAYILTQSTSVDDSTAPSRIAWKRDILDYWADVAEGARKALWVTEMQSAPWIGDQGFTTHALLQSASAYGGTGARVVLLYGVEDWLREPQWLTAGQQAIGILRGHVPPVLLPS
jgi:hypothetical protein